MKILLSLFLLPITALSKGYIVELNPNNTYTGPAKNIIKTSNKTFLVIESETYPKNKAFKYIEEDQDTFLLSTPKLEYFEKQWGLQNFGKNEPITPDRMSPVSSKIGIDSNAVNAWSLTKGRKDIVVAVVDTGLDLSHIELKSNLYINPAEFHGSPGVDDDKNGFIDDIHGYDFSSKDSIPQDENGHGTHCAGIIAGTHNKGRIAGVMSKASLMALRTLDKKGAGKISQAIEAFSYAIENGANVISNSWGSRGHSQILEDLIKDATSKGIHVVAAAGNSRFNNNDENATYPANYPGVVSVGAINARARHSAYSSFGPNTVHISAPGTNIISSHIKRKGEIYRVMSGTSMAAPFVSGAIGLYLSLYGKNQEPLAIRQKLIDSSTKLDHLKQLTVSEGMLNIEEFLKN